MNLASSTAYTRACIALASALVLSALPFPLTRGVAHAQGGMPRTPAPTGAMLTAAMAMPCPPTPARNGAESRPGSLRGPIRRVQADP